LQGPQEEWLNPGIHRVRTRVKEPIFTFLFFIDRMRWRIKALGSVACILAFSIILASQQSRHEGGSEVAVVVNSDVPVTSISLYDVRHVFVGDKQYWKSNMPVVLIVPPAGTHEREVMLHTVYRMNESQYRQYWIGRIFRAEAMSAPKTAESSTIANELVSSIPGCITIMNASEVRPGAKILRVDGKLPGERGYPLR
jgi:hypothetical protein